MTSSPDPEAVTWTISKWDSNPPVSKPVYTVASVDATYAGCKWHEYYRMMNRVLRRDYNRWIEEIVQGPSTIVARVQ